MTLKCTNTSPAKCNYLDLTISVYNGLFNFKSYDKSRDFSFEVETTPIYLAIYLLNPRMVYLHPNLLDFAILTELPAILW